MVALRSLQTWLPPSLVPKDPDDQQPDDIALLPDNLPSSLAPLNLLRCPSYTPPPPHNPPTLTPKPYHVPLHKPPSVCRRFKAPSVPTPPRDVAICVVTPVREARRACRGGDTCTASDLAAQLWREKRDVGDTWADVVCSAGKTSTCAAFGGYILVGVILI